jgi:hypothetical protein
MSHHRKCCCCVCNHCGGFGPAAYLVTFSGVTTCPTCKSASGASRRYHGDLNGTYRVTCNADVTPCSWEYREDSSPTIYVERYTGTICAGSPNLTSTEFTIQIIKLLGGNMRLVAQTGFPITTWYRAEIAAACTDEVIDLANAELCSGGINIGGEGGTASWVPD